LRRLLLAAGAALAPALAGCSTVAAPQPPPPRPSVRAPEPPRRSVPVPFDSAWNAALSFFAERKLPVETSDRARGIIASTRFAVASADSAAWLKCDKLSTPLLEKPPTTVSVTALLRVELHADGESTVARISLSASALDRKPPSSSEPAGADVTVDCPSTGALESALITRLRGQSSPVR
jgi:hypothetical protein